MSRKQAKSPSLLALHNNFSQLHTSCSEQKVCPVHTLCKESPVCQCAKRLFYCCLMNPHTSKDMASWKSFLEAAELKEACSCRTTGYMSLCPVWESWSCKLKLLFLCAASSIPKFHFFHTQRKLSCSALWNRTYVQSLEISYFCFTQCYKCSFQDIFIEQFTFVWQWNLQNQIVALLFCIFCTLRLHSITKHDLIWYNTLPRAHNPSPS